MGAVVGEGLGCDLAAEGVVDGFGAECTGIAFITLGDSSGLIVSLITSAAGFANVTGMFRCTSRLTVASSR